MELDKLRQEAVRRINSKNKEEQEEGDGTLGDVLSIAKL